MHTTKLITKKCHATQKRPRCAYTHPNQSICQHTRIAYLVNRVYLLNGKWYCVCSKISKYSQYSSLLKINWIWLCVIFAHASHTPTWNLKKRKEVHESTFWNGNFHSVKLCTWDFIYIFLISPYDLFLPNLLILPNLVENFICRTKFGWSKMILNRKENFAKE